MRGFWGLGANVMCCLALAGCGGSDALPVLAHIPNRDASACVITEVIEGELVRARCDGAPLVVRFLHYDTPDLAEAECRAEARAARMAQAHLVEILEGAALIVPKTHGRNRFDEVLVTIEIDRVPLHERMIGAGMAVPYSGGPQIDWCAQLRG
ncbi:MAG: hypothetical protein OIF47_17050 [Marinibacterium sp.]|nr:hypothetical protein [Marinibacterium sp.]